MAVQMSKGVKISLDKEAPNVKQFRIGLGWNVAEEDGVDFDLDASVLLLDKNGKVANLNEGNLVFYGNDKLQDPAGSVIHSGDNRTGDGDGDDEVINIDFEKVPAEVETLQVIVDIYKAHARRQNFGQVRNAYAKVYESATDKLVANLDLTEDYSDKTCIHVANFYRHNGEWKFEAVAIGSTDGLGSFIEKAGLETE